MNEKARTLKTVKLNDEIKIKRAEEIAIAKRDEIIQVELSRKHFPFTHGDVIDKQRKEIYETQKEEEKQLHKLQEEKKEAKRKELLAKALESKALLDLNCTIFSEERKLQELTHQEKMQKLSPEEQAIVERSIVLTRPKVIQMDRFKKPKD